VEQVIHVFHGFLGSPEDFSFLNSHGVTLHNLYHLTTPPVLEPDDILIGYSMGGRIALELAFSVNFNLKKIVLINAHPGLQTNEEIIERREFESRIMKELTTKSKDAFLNWWNELPLFHFDRPIEPSEEIYKNSIDLFHKHRLSEQTNYLPDIIHHKEKFLIILGLFDEKYMELGSEFFVPHGVNVKGIPGGHRLFQYPNELKKILTDEGIL
jgi:hypothetical protein